MSCRKHGALLCVIMLCALVCLSHPVAAKDFIYVPVSNAVQIIDCDTDTVVKTVPAYNDYIVGAAASPDGKRYYMNAFHSIYVLDTVTNELADVYRFSSDLNRVTILGFAVAPDGNKLYLSCSIVKKKQNIPRLDVLPPQLVVFDVKTKQIVNSYEIPYGTLGVLALRKDPNQLVLVGMDIYKLDLTNGNLKKVLGLLNPEPGEEVKNNLVIWDNSTPEDHGIFSNPYYTAKGMGYLIVDKNTGEVRTLNAADIFMEYSNIVSPDKKYIYAVMDELIKVDFGTGKTIKSVPVDRGTSYALSTTADGKKIYVGPSGADVSVYDTETLDRIGVIHLDADGVSAHRISH